MSTKAVSLPNRKNGWLTIDSWAVGIALLAALLIRIGVLTRIPW